MAAGGIREIEFFVQTQQLVFGGRRAGLRGPRTLDMLAALRDEDWVTDEAAAELAAAYRMLRQVEHRLQMLEDQQTQRLPTNADAFAAFAAFCGQTAGAFSRLLRRVFETVARHYARLFEEAEDLAGDSGQPCLHRCRP